MVPSSNPLQVTRSWVTQSTRYLSRPLQIVRDYRREYVMPDLLGGLTLAIVLLPHAIACALIANLPPAVGLYTAIFGGIVGALWGSSIPLNTGPTNAAALLMFSVLQPHVTADSANFLPMVGVLAVMVGAARLLFGMARLGVLVNFVSDAVVAGFTLGIGLLIAINQLPAFFGVSVPTNDGTIATLQGIWGALPQTNLPSLIIAVACLSGFALLRWLRPKWPGALLVMVASALAVALLKLDAQGVKTLGALPQQLPPFSIAPIWHWHWLRDLSVGALAITVIGLIEAISISRSFASLTGQRVDSNQEFVGQGLACIASGLLGGCVTSGSFARSAVNHAAGSKSPFANVFAAAWVALAMLLLGPYAQYLPKAALAGVLIFTAVALGDWGQIDLLLNSSHGDVLILIATIAATVLLPLEFAILTGVLVSFARYIISTSSPSLHEVLPDDKFDHLLPVRVRQEVCPQLGVLEIQGSLYFGAAHHLEDAFYRHYERNPQQRYLLIRMHQVNHCDISGINMLETMVRFYRQQGGDIFLVGVLPIVRERMTATGFDTLIGTDHFFSRSNQAVPFIFYRVLDPAICIYECDVKIWLECQNLPKRQLALAALPVQAGAVPSLTPQALWQQLRDAKATQPTLVDVRETREFLRGHIPNAVHYSLGDILQHSLPEQIAKDTPIVLICKSDRRSRRAAQALQAQGYRQLQILAGGMLAWSAAKYLEAVEDTYEH